MLIASHWRIYDREAKTDDDELRLIAIDALNRLWVQPNRSDSSLYSTILLIASRSQEGFMKIRAKKRFYRGQKSIAVASVQIQDYESLKVIRAGTFNHEAFLGPWAATARM